MNNYIPITWLNDFIFCPYSVYLHQIYGKGQEEVYHTKKQAKGKRLHAFVEFDKNKETMTNAYVYSGELEIYGKIDTYDLDTGLLIEYKSKATRIYRGYYYQIWSQYYCLIEMGFEVKSLAFYDFKLAELINIEAPNKENYAELKNHIQYIKSFDFDRIQQVNINKCKNCIYINLCDKTQAYAQP